MIIVPIRCLIVSLILLLFAEAVQAHGLTMTTAGVSLRQKNHLTLRLEYDPVLLWQAVNTPPNEAAVGLAVLANMPETAFEQGYASMQQHLRENIRIHFDNKALASPQFRFPHSAEFRREIRDLFMSAVLGNGQHQDDHRKHYQTVNIDGFLPKDANVGNLAIDFPPTLGKIMVTFSIPETQTLSPNTDGTHYRYRLTRNENR